MTLFEPRAPAIPPLPSDVNRPQWSVMIPVYEPGPFLEVAIASVLAQKIDAQQMQIVVVDDASPTVDVASLVTKFGDRVEYYRNPNNLGPIDNWNHCLKLAKGHWVHLLHQDDFIQPKFYEKLGGGLAASKNVGAAFCRHLYVDDSGETTDVSILESNVPGILHRWQERIAEIQRVQFVSIVVRRSVYEVLGGFSPTAASATDWEMWQRISGFYPLWYEPAPLSSFRLHKRSETSQLLRQGGNIVDSNLAIAACGHYLVPPMRAALAKAARKNYGLSAMETAGNFLNSGDTKAALAQIRAGLDCSRSPVVIEKLCQILDDWKAPKYRSNFSQTSASQNQECNNDDSRSLSENKWENFFNSIETFKTRLKTGEPFTFRAIRIKILQVWLHTEEDELQSFWDKDFGNIFKHLINHGSSKLEPNEVETRWIQYIQDRLFKLKEKPSTEDKMTRNDGISFLILPLLLYKDLSFIQSLVSDKPLKDMPDYLADAVSEIALGGLDFQGNQGVNTEALNSNKHLSKDSPTFIF
ncbi:MAG: glycosyltransferase family 2 protein [Cyanobacteria bacterium P01_C01_bin.89]